MEEQYKDNGDQYNNYFINMLIQNILVFLHNLDCKLIIMPLYNLNHFLNQRIKDLFKDFFIHHKKIN
jgi:hypothetical protein